MREKDKRTSKYEAIFNVNILGRILKAQVERKKEKG